MADGVGALVGKLSTPIPEIPPAEPDGPGWAEFCGSNAEECHR